jgi:hypothetical protein
MPDAVASPPAATVEPQWPTDPQWPSQRPAASLPVAARGRPASDGLESLWAASSQQVQAAPTEAARQGGVQPCISCGLSLSATARFCRRCGTRQS